MTSPRTACDIDAACVSCMSGLVPAAKGYGGPAAVAASANAGQRLGWHPCGRQRGRAAWGRGGRHVRLVRGAPGSGEHLPGDPAL